MRPFRAASPLVVGFGSGGGPTLSAFSDDFNRTSSASLGANWTEAAGDGSIVSNTLLQVNTGSYAENVYAYTGTACATVNQYVKVTFQFLTGADYPAIILRYTDASSPMYAIFFFNSEDRVIWTRKANAADGSFTTIQTVDPFTVASGDVYGVTIDGTGTSTVVRIWRTPPSNTPTSSSNWGGDTTPDATFTTDPASPVDTGNYVGLGGETGSAGNVVFDNFFGGDCP